MKILNEAVDQVRREEQKTHPELKKSRYIWLKNPQNLSAKQQTMLECLDVKERNLKTARTYQIKLTFQELYQQPPHRAETFLQKWYFWATHSRSSQSIASQAINRPVQPFRAGDPLGVGVLIQGL